MADRPDPGIGDDFSALYKEYTGPIGSNVTNIQDKEKTDKRSHANSSDEEEPRDPNAIPTGFTSREAKVWEAKSKAIERNWKKRKEEEMICKICGESGHFTQGCPTTLGANHKSQDFFERVPAREKHVKALFTERVIQKIEKDIGCKIKLEEKFIIISGNDRLLLAKGVNAVHKLKEEGEKKGSSSAQIIISRSPKRRNHVSSRFGSTDSVHKLKEEGERKGSSSARMNRSKSPKRRSPVSSRFGRSDSQRSLPSPRYPSQFQLKIGRQDNVVEDRVREDLQKLARGSPQAYGNDRARGRSSHSKSPPRPPYTGISNNSHEDYKKRMVAYRAYGWDAERQESDMQSGRNFDYLASPRTLEELELECKREAMELERIRDKEEDEEKYKHCEVVKEMRENYMKKLGNLRRTQAKQWEEFHQLAHQQISLSGFGGYKQGSNPEYANSGANITTMDLRSRYLNPEDNSSSTRPHDTCTDFQRQRREDYGKAYNRY
ncbi:hypothetical protein U1Q18_040837 [Sarracenia purpurea var. burkii]